MCRFVILAVIAASFISCVLAQTSKPEIFNNTNCVNHERMVQGRKDLKRCFNTTVELYLNSSATLATGDCRNAADFGRQLDRYFTTLNEVCVNSSTNSINTTNIVKLIEYSLLNDSFKSLINDRKCLEYHEYDISNTCVKGKLGFFNISNAKKHTTWYKKTNLKYNENTCPNSFLVGNCVAATLQPCTLTTTEYVKKLFIYARELGACDRFPETATLPPPRASTAGAPWLTLPVIITLSIGAVVVVGAVITIIVLKCKNK